jgi:5-formyltetrahydrofolate cyclo-ligase
MMELEYESILNRKKILREKILTLLRNQKEEYRQTKSLAIQKKLFLMHQFQKAKAILFYASFDGEVETFEMMKQAQRLGKKIGLPKIMLGQKEIIPLLADHLSADIHEGPYGIQEPVEVLGNRLTTNSIDMVIVPGVAFDEKNNRLGRGGGYYDRFLKTIPSGIPTVGLAFDFQIVSDLPVQPEHDVALTHVLVN